MAIHPAVSLSGVSKTYKGAPSPALDDVSVRIEHGEFVYLTGPSGSGKSTLIKLCLREERANAGKVRVLGQDVARLTARQVPALRRRCAAVFQDYRLLPAKTVAANVAFALEALDADTPSALARVDEALELVGLTHKAHALPNELSGGEAQRVAIARALVGRPVVLFADEPTGNLDPHASDAIIALLEAVNHSGTTVVVATHDARLVDARPRRVLRLTDGQLVADGVGTYAAAEAGR